MNIVKRSKAVSCSLLLLLVAAVDTAAGDDYADGKLGKALILDGSSHTVKIPHYAGLKPAKAITISAWIKPERVGKGGWAWQQIYRKEDGNARALMAIGEYEKKHSLCFGLGIRGKYVEHGVPLEPAKLLDGKWHLVGVTFDGKAMKFYADGKEIGATTKASGAIDTGGEAPAYIGSYQGTGEFFKGGIDDVRLYNRALSTDEIKTMALDDGKETVDTISAELGEAPLSVADDEPAVPLQKQKATEHVAQTTKPFTIAVLPDTQFYCDTRLKLSAKWGNGDLRRYFFAQTEWVRDNQERLNIAFLVHEGDIVQADAPEEWAIAKKAMSVLDGKVPYCMCLGNHDMGFEKADNEYGGNIGVNRTTHFNTYFPREKFAKRHEFGGTFDPYRHDNSWYHFEAAGMSFLIVSLECKPRDEVLDWANKIVSEQPDHRVIVLTHAYMDAKKSRNTGGMKAKGNTGEQTWQKFVKKHKNIFMVLCGHHTGEAVRSDAGDHGNQVHQILCDYQHLNNGGESWLRYMVFKPGANKINIYTYNPALDKFKKGPSSRFDLDYPMALPPDTVPGITRPGAANDVNKEAVDGIVGWWKLDGDLKNSAAKTVSGSVAQFRGVDRKWKATPLSLGGAQLDIRAAGEAAVRVTTGVNLAPVAEPSTSHVSGDTSLAALHDGHAPATSHVRGEGSYGNWPSKGTQWVQYDWTAPVNTRKIDVFWWDDHGGVRLPKACRLLYWDGKRFVPVQNPSGLGVAKDKFNTTTFDEVRTSKLRLEIDGDGDFSTGILEWKVYNEGELPNFPPSVMAGVDRIVMQGRETPLAGQLLRAISTDTTKVSWSKTSGPGKVAFADDAALATTATFSAVGDYVLTLTARKGKMSDSSTLAVRVVARPQLDIRAAGKTGVRITIQPHDSKDKFPYTPALVERDYPKAVISLRELDSAFEPVKARVGNVNVTVQSNPLSVLVTTLDNEPLQKITFAPNGTMSFVLDDQPVLGMGEGGPKQTGDSWRTDKIELDRRGRLHPMTPWYGTGTYGSYNPVPLMIGTAGWGLFIPTPSGAIDLSDSETGRFIPADPISPGTVVSRRQQREGRIGLPPPEYFIPGTYDVFVFDAQDPAAFMKDISTLSGPAVLPPKWVMGYQQSHRTLKDETQMLEIIDTFRKKNIPLDSVCYLGTGFCPNGWNKKQPSFEFNPGVFKRDPQEVLADMHKRNVKVMMHMIPWDRDRLATIQGTISPKPGEKLDNTHIQNYWNEHNALVDAGVDAWWPDEGDWFNFHERMKRHELYYTGPLSKQPNVRPWSLHRNGYLGVARWGGWMWPGDPLTTWRTLQTHIAIGINHSLSVSPFWNSDIGAFYTTDEYSAELYVRWVQFATFNSLMRCHGRGWENRLPWAWGQSEPGTGEGSYAPPKSALNNPTVEPIAKKYIELRYQLLTYNYTLAWQARETGMPMMRSMWLHHPTDPKVRSIGDQYLWGRDLLIAPVYKKGATTRDVYLPAGKWYDWWTDKAETGGRTVQRAVDLATMPIYVRAGAIVPFDPVRQYTGQKVDEPMTLKIYRGANGKYTLYDDDGISLDYLKGSSVETLIQWDDAAKRLTIEPQAKDNTKRTFKIELIPDGTSKEIRYAGQRLEVRL